MGLRLVLPVHYRAADGYALGSRNPGRGVTNFDTFPWAFVNVVVVSTLSNWVDMMFPLWDATSWLVYLYMLSIILLGSFFAVNVFIVRVGTCTRSARWPVCEHGTAVGPPACVVVGILIVGCKPHIHE
jgi:hypothetical protein